MTPEVEMLEKHLLSSADWISYVLLAGVALAIVTVVHRFYRRNAIEVAGIAFPLRHMWFVFLAYTAAHLFTVVLFIQGAADIHHHPEHPKPAQRSFQKLVHEGPFVFRSLSPRLMPLPAANGIKRVGFARMSWTDPTTYLFYASAIAFFAAQAPWRFPGKQRRRFWLSLGLACALTLANWLIGSNWAIAASELTLTDQTSATTLHSWKPSY